MKGSVGLLVAAILAAQVPAWPVARARHHMVFDPATQQLLLLGGAQVLTGGARRDTSLWSWNGSRWQATATSAPVRANEAVAFDSSRGRLVVHGGSSLTVRGELEDTWEFDGKSWQLVSDEGPGMRAHHAMAYDPVRKQTVLFGNSDNALANDTWGWDGRAWRRLAASGPPRRGVTTMAFDARRGVIVMFGGMGSRGKLLNDTWEWDGGQWRQVETAAAPPARFDARMTYDSAAGRMILFGGRGATGNLGDTWAYDGRSWTALEVGGPSPRNGHAMVYHQGRKAIVLFGGRNEPDYFDDMWTFDGAWRLVAQR